MGVIVTLTGQLIGSTVFYFFIF